MRKGYLVIAGWILLAACVKNAEDKPKTAAGLAPERAELVFPKKDEACTEGEILSSTQSSINFYWNAGKNTTSYTVVLKNLQTGDSLTLSTDTAGLKRTLKRETPYSWYVISKSDKSTEAATSEVWKFYNSGLGVLSHSPFPADIISPTLGETITSDIVNLTWTGNDVDNDIVSYDVYLRTTIEPSLKESGLTQSLLSNIEVSKNTTFYWKIITKDSKGNSSESALYQFMVK